MFVASFLAWFARAWSGARVRWVGSLSGARPRVYYANHTSHLDAVVVWAALPKRLRAHTRPVAAEDYWSKGLIRRYLASKVFRALLIPRHESVAAPESHPAHERMLAALHEGCSLILFPEGTRSTNGSIGTFRYGLYHLAVDCPQVELVPVHLSNLDRVMPKGSLVPVPLFTEIIFGSPVERIPREPREAFLLRAREALAALGRR